MTIAKLFGGFGIYFWEIFGYNTHSTNNAYKSTTSVLRHYNDGDSRCLCIIGIGRKTQTTWNP